MLFTAPKSSAESLFIFAISPAKNHLKTAFTGSRGELRGVVAGVAGGRGLISIIGAISVISVISVI